MIVPFIGDEMKWLLHELLSALWIDDDNSLFNIHREHCSCTSK